MWLRTRLNIGWRDLAFALSACVGSACVGPTRGSSEKREDVLAKIRRRWAGDTNVLVTLSVRSGFDLLLRTLALPAGSEILLTAITVPGMIQIAESHGLKVVPVDLDESGHIKIDSLRVALTENTKILVVAHLFGDQTPLDGVRETLRGHDVLLVEDCAQSFSSAHDLTEPVGDVALYSFGPIKTATALGGGVAEIKNDRLAIAMRSNLGRDPIQSNRSFARRVLRFSLLKCLTARPIASCLFLALKLLNISPDGLLLKMGRGFSGPDFLDQIRHRPSLAQLRLLERRLSEPAQIAIETRIANGRYLDQQLGILRRPAHKYWAYNVAVVDPAATVDALRAMGLDATARTRLALVPSDDPARTMGARSFWDHVIYIPCYQGISRTKLLEASRCLKHSLVHTPTRPTQANSCRSDAKPDLQPASRRSGHRSLPA